MPSIFDTVAAPLMADATQDHFGEPIVYRPMRRVGPNAAYEVDPTRPVRADITGAFTEVPEDVDANGDAYAPRADQRPRHSSAKIGVLIRQADLGYEPAAGDRIERTEKGLVYSTGAPKRYGASDVLLPLNLAT